MDRQFKGKKSSTYGGGKKFGGFGGGSRGFGGGSRSFDSREGGRPTMHKAVCGDCGNQCEVPFIPTGNRPVYCNNCFHQDGNTAAPKKFGTPRFGEARPEPGAFGREMSNKNMEQMQAQLAKINSKIDSILEILNEDVE